MNPAASLGGRGRTPSMPLLPHGGLPAHFLDAFSHPHAALPDTPSLVIMFDEDDDAEDEAEEGELPSPAPPPARRGAGRGAAGAAPGAGGPAPQRAGARAAASAPAAARPSASAPAAADAGELQRLRAQVCSCSGCFAYNKLSEHGRLAAHKALLPAGRIRWTDRADLPCRPVAALTSGLGGQSLFTDLRGHMSPRGLLVNTCTVPDCCPPPSVFGPDSAARLRQIAAKEARLQQARVERARLSAHAGRVGQALRAAAGGASTPRGGAAQEAEDFLNSLAAEGGIGGLVRAPAVRIHA